MQKPSEFPMIVQKTNTEVQKGRVPLVHKAVKSAQCKDCISLPHYVIKTSALSCSTSSASLNSSCIVFRTNFLQYLFYL